jgi:hypothetical protein
LVMFSPQNGFSLSPRYLGGEGWGEGGSRQVMKPPLTLTLSPRRGEGILMLPTFSMRLNCLRVVEKFLD